MRESKKLQENKAAGRAFAGGSTPKDKETSKAPFVGFRVTAEEMAQLKHLSAGMSVSAYIRKCLFGGDGAPRKIRLRAPVKDQEALGRVLGLLGQSRIANNLNQLAYDANSGTLLLDQQSEDQINEAYAYVRSMRLDLTQALGIGGQTQH
ncbi:plasmid mobilization relaxosome protein MobC [Pararhizobium sp. IMCC21322]|uniref:plasmid mobilization protein n=1 Tax=Pararhizobium sp. IMCC21322 TaxID=3067903 RepID=UPI0027415440|nr:plasmid mobilization relaxosome protein MobC [Pararhizobium sp. IMCC21322]